MASLLVPLTDDQKALVDCVAEAFADGEEQAKWPIFDYVEGMLERNGRRAGEILASFPRAGRWNYGAVWWRGLESGRSPRPEDEVGLTLLGMSRSAWLAKFAKFVVAMLEIMAQRWESAPLSPQRPRTASMTRALVEGLAGRERIAQRSCWPGWFPTALAREPFFAGLERAGATWETISVPREARAYAGIDDIDGYVETLEELTAVPHVPVAPSTPSPLDLVGALDYLDAIWRLAHDKKGLFSYPSAERVAKLAYPPNTTDELGARLSALAEILRSAETRARAVRGRRGRGRPGRDRSLAALAEVALETVGEEGRDRVKDAIAVLEDAIALRDAGQHADAAPRAVAAAKRLGIDYPFGDVAATWAMLTRRVIEALSALREEIDAATRERATAPASEAAQQQV